jgi:hypothetical protein
MASREVISIERYTELYQAFRNARDVAFKLAALAAVKKESMETNSRFALRLAQWYEPHRRALNDVDKAFEGARDAGVKFLTLIFLHWKEFEEANRPYLAQQGLSEIANVWLFTIPLEVINWKKMQEPLFQDVTLDNWRNVLLLSTSASPTRYPFYSDVYRGMQDKDPFPTRDMNDIDADVQSTVLPPIPASLLDTAKEYGASKLGIVV